jgi:SulP family sulfate permease
MLARVFPALGWLLGYRRSALRGDTTAGLTTAVMLIPQAMAYAMLAGLPPVVGLYSSLAPLVVYALFGSSRQLAVGPVAIDSLLVAAGIGALMQLGGPQDLQTYVSYAVMLALMVGLLQLALGVFRAGFLTNFLSRPVVGGFTSAAALVIGFSQLKHLLGVELPRSKHVHTILLSLSSQLGEIHPTTLAIGLVSLVLLLALKRLSPLFPRALTVVVLGTLVVGLLGLDQRGVSIVGYVPPGLPRPHLPFWDWQVARALLPTAAVIALVAFMEAYSVARAVAARHRYEVDANQELVALGLANIAGSMSGSYPVTGGFSRTAVNDQAGAQTPLASLITVATIALALLALTPLFHYLPHAVLASIIIAAVIGLVDVAQARQLYRVKPTDLALMILTFVATLGLGIVQGILVGVGASLLWFVVRTTRPHTAVLGRLPGTEVYRNIANYPEVERLPGLLALRMDAQFYFGNVSFLKDTLRRLERESAVPLRVVLIDASSINQLDSSAAVALLAIAEDYRQRDITLLFANTKRPVHQVMQRVGLVDLLGSESFYLRVHDAVSRARDLL